VTGATKAQIGELKSPTPPTPTREVGVAEAKVAETGGRVLRVEVKIDMSDDNNDESSDRRELEKARVADTPDEDPREQSTEVAEAEAADTDTDE